jgi:hypothetical protein
MKGSPLAAEVCPRPAGPETTRVGDLLLIEGISAIFANPYAGAS